MIARGVAIGGGAAAPPGEGLALLSEGARDSVCRIGHGELPALDSPGGSCRGQFGKRRFSRSNLLGQNG